MINWNEVTVGETEIEKHNYPKRVILAIYGDWVWAKDYSGHMTIHKNELIGWTIYDPWVDVSHECIISSAYDIYHDGKLLTLKDEVNGQYKRQQGPGLRVWKRKEGVGDD